jgi:hypothetical protein
VIAHAIIESYYSRFADSGGETRLKKSRAFYFARLIEDWGYQALIRKEVTLNVLPALGLQHNQLASQEDKICSIIEQKLNEFKYMYLRDLTPDDIKISNVHLPWHRMFEVGFAIDLECSI